MAEENGSEQRNGAGPSGSILDTLKSKELILPAALSAVGAVAASKGPDLIRHLTQTTEQKGEDEARRMGRSAAEGARSGMKGGLGGVAGKALGAFGGGGGGGKKTRRLPVQRWTDVAVPVATAYEEWTNFEEFPKFMHRVLDVSRQGDDKVRWQEKIWFSKRDWEGRITERRKNDRIAWTTTSGMSHHGVVTFHRLDDNLTRVMVDMEFEPNGMIEKMASGLRFVKRAVEADLARFKAHCEMKDAKGIEYRASRSSGGGGERRRSTKDDAERDEERREREQRRKERRESSVGAAS
ncbi:MAG TPA: SRPBCC family protein [Gaiellaceae bacterium]|nr:SRPBCC family protein [Gaiellaceae bacterium]